MCVSMFVMCVCMCMKVEVTPHLTFYAPRGHTLFRRMQTPRLMDDRSACFPGFIFTREIVIHPLGEAERRTRSSLLPQHSISPGSRMQRMKRLRAQLPWLSSQKRWSKSSATAVPSSDSTALRNKAVYGATKNTACFFL